MNSRKFLCTFACLLGAAFSSGPLSAQTSLTLNLDTVVPLTTFAGHAGNNDFGGEIAGLLNFTVASQTPAFTYPLQLSLFCVELAQNINLPSTGNLYSVISVDQASSIPGGNAGYGANILAGGIGSTRAINLERLYALVFGSTYNPLALSNSDRSAFQLAVWELSHDTDFDLTTVGTSPHFWITSTGAAVTQAQAWVTAVAGLTSAAPQMALSAVHSDTLQDFLVPTNPNTIAPIPEAATSSAIMGLLALTGMIGLRANARNRRFVSSAA